LAKPCEIAFIGMWLFALHWLRATFRESRMDVSRDLGLVRDTGGGIMGARCECYSEVFFVLAALLANPESSRELHSRYGEPDIERFVVRPGVGLTVEYGSDGQACQMMIEGQNMLIEKEQPPKACPPKW